MRSTIKLFIHEYWDDILEYFGGLIFFKFGFINVFSVFLEKWGMTFDYSYFGATGGLTWWLITKYKEQIKKENGEPYKKVTFFRAMIYLFLSMIFAVLFTSLLQKSFLPQLALHLVGFGAGLFWEDIYRKFKKIFDNGLEDKNDFKTNSSNEDTDHPNKPGG